MSEVGALCLEFSRSTVSCILIGYVKGSCRVPPLREKGKTLVSYSLGTSPCLMPWSKGNTKLFPPRGVGELLSRDPVSPQPRDSRRATAIGDRSTAQASRGKMGPVIQEMSVEGQPHPKQKDNISYTPTALSQLKTRKKPFY